MTVRRVWPWLLMAWGLCALGVYELMRWLESMYAKPRTGETAG